MFATARQQYFLYTKCCAFCSVEVQRDEVFRREVDTNSRKHVGNFMDWRYVFISALHGLLIFNISGLADLNFARSSKTAPSHTSSVVSFALHLAPALAAHTPCHFPCMRHALLFNTQMIQAFKFCGGQHRSILHRRETMSNHGR